MEFFFPYLDRSDIEKTIFQYLTSEVYHELFNMTAVADGQIVMELGSFLTIRQIAECLQTSRSTVDKWIHSGRLKYVRINGRDIRIRQSDFIDFWEAEAKRQSQDRYVRLI